jgi:hypothetical protein
VTGIMKEKDTMGKAKRRKEQMNNQTNNLPQENAMPDDAAGVRSQVSDLDETWGLTANMKARMDEFNEQIKSLGEYAARLATGTIESLTELRERALQIVGAAQSLRLEIENAKDVVPAFVESYRQHLVLAESRFGMAANTFDFRIRELRCEPGKTNEKFAQEASVPPMLCDLAREICEEEEPAAKAEKLVDAVAMFGAAPTLTALDAENAFTGLALILRDSDDPLWQALIKHFIAKQAVRLPDEPLATYNALVAGALSDLVDQIQCCFFDTFSRVFYPAPEWKDVYGVTSDDIEIGSCVVPRFKMVFSNEGAERVGKAFQEDFKSGGLTKEMVEGCGGMGPELLVIFMSEQFKQVPDRSSPTSGSPWSKRIQSGRIDP